MAHCRSTIVVLAATLLARPAMAQAPAPRETVLERFVRYARINTQSKEDAGKVPSTEAQLDLARLLAAELTGLGVDRVRVSEHGIVYGLLPSNLPAGTKVQAVGFIAHMDTAPNEPGAGVTPIVHRNYQGGDILLPGDSTRVIRVADNPGLKDLIGDDIVTADGTTLLGSDDKSGCAEIMTLLDILTHNPAIRHGPIAVAFMPDEEVGGAVEFFDIPGFGARVAYTVDGGALGGVNDETFSARTAYVSFAGRDGAPVKGRLVNSLYAVGDFVSRIPEALRPENAEGREGYVHPYTATLNTGASTLKLRLRAFKTAELDAQEAMLRRLTDSVAARYPAVKVSIEVKPFYSNMKDSLDRYPALIANAMEATRRAGLTPTLTAIRGGTDGSNLTSRGLPTPDLFTGGHNFHTRQEFNSRKGMEKTVEMLVHLVRLFAGVDSSAP
ncbi:MAG TPA: peptidase T [Gemmatimonadales bacterium]|nr:peptidase T [Gemmatimonadales bacterium]